jgi:signal peptidase I
MASSLANATTHAGEARSPSPLTAAILTLITPGLGHLYLGYARRGVALFALVIVADTLLMFALMGVLARFLMFAISLALLFGLWLFIVIDATKLAYRTHEYPREPYNRWQVYVGAAAFAWLLTAIPFIYAFHAKASGQLGYFHVSAPNMEPTLRAGEYFLADATYYQNHQPSRGDVVIYVDPNRPREHFIRRVVAVANDRIAVRNGRVIRNGIAVVEPYVAPNAPGVLFVPETMVPPGHVFLLGDNRSERPENLDTIASGVVPTDRLIGRATEIAFSRVMTRMGRWIGTPNNL